MLERIADVSGRDIFLLAAFFSCFLLATSGFGVFESLFYAPFAAVILAPVLALAWWLLLVAYGCFTLLRSLVIAVKGTTKRQTPSSLR
jgi:hypothetical protein